MIPEILATLACGIFAGAAIYVNLVEQPARLSCGIALAITEWRPSYQRGAVMQASLALVGSALAFFSAWLSRDLVWIIGGALLFAVGPFTLLVIFPTNKKLQSAELDVTSSEGASSAIVGPTACGAQRAELAGIRGFPLRVEIWPRLRRAWLAGGGRVIISVPPTALWCNG
jgi:Domain of unknown function (DUF1772)